MSLTESAAVDVARSASLASRQLAILPNAARNEALTALHKALDQNRDFILAANARDVEAATSAANSGNLSHSVLKRLDLTRPGKFDDMLQGILNVRDLEDPGESTICVRLFLMGISVSLQSQDMANPSTWWSQWVRSRYELCWMRD